ncbi:AMIN domain-containing protein [bacterium]|nr:AMIN domain-containing protein [bacterium]
MKRHLLLIISVFVFGLLFADNSITGLSLEQRKDILCVNISGKIPQNYKVVEMSAPFRIVIDFPETIYKEATRLEKPLFYPVDEIRLAQFKQSPPIARLVVQMAEKTSYYVVQEDNKLRLLIKGREKPQTEAPEKKRTRDNFPILPVPTAKLDNSQDDPKPDNSDVKHTISYDNGLISIDFLKTDIRDVFKSLTMQTGINFFLSSEVKGEVTLTAENIKVEDAIEMICKLNNLVFKKEKAGYIIATPQEMERLSPVPTITTTIPLKFAKPSDIQPVLEKVFPKGKFQVVGNAIAATVPVEELQSVSKFISDLDTAQAPPEKEKEVTEVIRLSYLDVDDAIEMLKNLYPEVKAAKAPGQAFTAFAAMAGGYGMGGYGMGGYGGLGGLGAGTTTGTTGVGGLGGLGMGYGAGMGMGYSPAMFQQKPDKLVLSGPESIVNKAKETLKKLDIPPKQIHIQVRITDISEDAAKQIGIEWGFPISQTFTESASEGLKIGRIDRSPLQVAAQLDAILSSGKGIQLANPSLALIDGRGANILVGERIMYTKRTGITPLGMPIYEIAEEQVGVILRLNAKIAEDNSITLYVRPEISYLIGMTGPENLPQIATRQAETVLRLKSGESIVLGGLLQEKDLEQMRKVPLLADLPFFGNLFRWRSKTKTHSEILIFITASVIE